MIEVSVKLYSSLKRYSTNKDGTITISVKEGTTIEDILSKGGIIQGEAEIVRLNGKVLSEDSIIMQKSTIEVFPIFGGG